MAKLGTHFRPKYVEAVLAAQNDTKKLTNLFFPKQDIPLPTDITNPNPEELLEYYYSVRKKKFIKNFQNRFNGVFFGSARSEKSDEEYKFAEKVIQALIEERKIGAITGGGPGIMEAILAALLKLRNLRYSNGQTANNKAIGVTIQLPFEETDASADKIIQHEGFFTRIPDMFDFGNAAYVLPGGIGSIFEMFGVLQLKQVKHLEKQFPLLVHPIYEKLLNEVYESMYKTRNANALREFISPNDISTNIIITDKIPDIVGSFIEAYDWWHKNFREPYKKIKETKGIVTS